MVSDCPNTQVTNTIFYNNVAFLGGLFLLPTISTQPKPVGPVYFPSGSHRFSIRQVLNPPPGWCAQLVCTASLV